MDTYKSPRFWIAMAVVTAATVLAALKVVSGDTAVGLLGGIVAGLGISTNKSSAAGNGIVGAIAAVGIGGALLAGCDGGINMVAGMIAGVVFFTTVGVALIVDKYRGR